MAKKKEQPTHGGKREGAGRKAGRFIVRLPQGWHVAGIDHTNGTVRVVIASESELKEIVLDGPNGITAEFDRREPKGKE